jgi:Cu/Ag efflux protein CusF
MTRMIQSLMLATSLFAFGSQAQLPSGGNPVEMQPTGTPGKAAASRSMRITATVYAIDVGTRILTLQHDMGGVETMKVGPEVKDLDKFAPGDTVVVEFDQGLALEFQPAGSAFVPPTAVATGNAAERGASTVAAGGQTVKSTVVVTRIDAAKRLVTLETPGGQVYKVKAGPKVKLDSIKVGDRLLATYVEATAIRLEKAKARAGK